ncbi:MAG: F0F1 ATP synthase subunit alpha, partial [Marinobacter sp.]|nr:F0F1 ATP synthase subunit alpha [Marinobacter sp.]
EELEEFARFGTRLDDVTRSRLTRGAAVRAALRQAERDPMPAVEQLSVLMAAMEGLFDGLSEQAVLVAMNAVREAAKASLSDLAGRLDGNQSLPPDDRAQIITTARQALQGLAVADGGDDGRDA